MAVLLYLVLSAAIGYCFGYFYMRRQRKADIKQMSDENERLYACNEYNKELLEEWQRLRVRGCRDLRVEEHRHLNGMYPSRISVVAYSPIDSRVSFVLKDFVYNDNIIGDKEFAKREADEFIEIVQNF